MSGGKIKWIGLITECFVANSPLGWRRRPRRRKFSGVLWHNPGCDEASQPPFGHHFYKAITELNRSIFDEIRHILNNFLEYEC
jgi:hypothetical protein